MPPARRTSSPAQRGPARPRGRARASLSIEAILDAAVQLLDEAGEASLTFRALAARLGGGVGSLYWYVSSKDELLDRATDHVMAEFLEQTEALAASSGSATGDTATGDTATRDTADPIATLRALGLALFDSLEAHPWLAGYLMRDVGIQPNSMRVYERFGQQILRLDLSRQQRFHAVSAIVNYVVGVGADMGQAPTRAGIEEPTELDRDAYLAEAVQQWRDLPADEFPFVHHVAPEFEHHRDEDQFSAGLDLLLAGLRLQAGGR